MTETLIIAAFTFSVTYNRIVSQSLEREVINNKVEKARIEGVLSRARASHDYWDWSASCDPGSRLGG